MYVEQQDVFYYITVENENYPMPSMPGGDHVREGILKGMYKYLPADAKVLRNAKHRAILLGSGAILNEAVKAQELLARNYQVAADVWSVTSYKALHQDGSACDRHNLLHPGDVPRKPFVTQCLEKEEGVVVAASDYTKILPDSIARWVPGQMVSLGTDGFGRSDARDSLRDFFEVDYRFITLGVLSALARRNELPHDRVVKAMQELRISPDKPDPLLC